MEKPGTLFPRSFGSFLFPLLATMHAGEGAGGDPTTPGNSVTGRLNTQGFPVRGGNDGGDGSGGGDGGSGGGTDGDVGSVGGGGGGGSGGGGAWSYGARAVRSPDERLALIVRSYGRAMCELAGTPDPEGHALLQAALEEGEWEAGGGSWEQCVGRHGGGGGVRRERDGAESPRRRSGAGDDGGRGAGEGQGGGRGGGSSGGGGATGLAELMEKTRCGC